MERAEVTQLCECQVLGTAAGLFGTSKEALGKFDDYEGCANLVYHYENEGQPRILRLSYRSDRPVELIQAELHFVEYLAAGGVHVAQPVPSIHGNLLEVIPTTRMNFIAVSFLKGKGMRVPDNGYRYREGVPMQEYFQNWGQVLGKMHRMAKTYQPTNEAIKRPEWHQVEYYSGFP